MGLEQRCLVLHCCIRVRKEADQFARLERHFLPTGK